MIFNNWEDFKEKKLRSVKMYFLTLESGDEVKWTVHQNDEGILIEYDDGEDLKRYAKSPLAYLENRKPVETVYVSDVTDNMPDELKEIINQHKQIENELANHKI